MYSILPLLLPPVVVMALKLVLETYPGILLGGCDMNRCVNLKSGLDGMCRHYDQELRACAIQNEQARRQQYRSIDTTWPAHLDYPYVTEVTGCSWIKG